VAASADSPSKHNAHEEQTMSLEEALAANTAALIANTDAHNNLTAVASAAAGAKAGGKAESKAEDAGEETAAEKKAAAAAKKKATAAALAKKKAAAAEKPADAPDLSKLADGVAAAKLKTLAGGFLKGDDEESRDANKEKFLAALEHLGAGKLGEIDSAEDRAKMAAYVVYWSKGAEVDFEAVDEIVLGIIGGDDDAGGDDDLLG
jgi:hypothetical protein